MRWHHYSSPTWPFNHNLKSHSTAPLVTWSAPNTVFCQSEMLPLVAQTFCAVEWLHTSDCQRRGGVTGPETFGRKCKDLYQKVGLCCLSLQWIWGDQPSWCLYPTIIISKWKMGPSNMKVSFHLVGDFPLNHGSGRKGSRWTHIVQWPEAGNSASWPFTWEYFAFRQRSRLSWSRPSRGRNRASHRVFVHLLSRQSPKMSLPGKLLNFTFEHIIRTIWLLMHVMAHLGSKNYTSIAILYAFEAW